jgi:outer membrane cobalamin receptor
MNGRSRRSAAPLRLGAAAVLAACAACAAHGPARPGEVGEAAHGRVITQEEIARSGAVTAWDVLKGSKAGFRAWESTNGEPLRLRTRRGRSSMIDPESDSPLIVVDGVRLADLRPLAQLQAAAIRRIRILDGIDGTVYEGTNAGSGVVIIQTKNEPDWPTVPDSLSPADSA